MFQVTLMIIYRMLPPAQVAGSENMRIRVQQILYGGNFWLPGQR